MNKDKSLQGWPLMKTAIKNYLFYLENLNIENSISIKMLLKTFEYY